MRVMIVLAAHLMAASAFFGVAPNIAMAGECDIVGLKPCAGPPQIFEPPPGDSSRAAVLDALRPRYEKIFGASIQFKVMQIKIAGGYAYVSAHPMRPGGAPIEPAAWKRGTGGVCEYDAADIEIEAILKQSSRGWSLQQASLCADDSMIDVFRQRAGLEKQR